MKALSQAVPTQVSAGIGNLRVVAFSGMEDGKQWAHMEILEGSYGGRHDSDGMDAIDTLFANTRNNPIEDIESHLPIRVDRYELRDDATPAGRMRGGIGTVHEFTFLADGAFSVEGDGHKYRPWGYDSGEDGYTASLKLIHKAGGETDLVSKVPYHKIKAGDHLISRGPSGGGYGDPFERNAQSVLFDVLEGLISAEAAERLYGVAINGESIDMDRTAKLRSA